MNVPKGVTTEEKYLNTRDLCVNPKAQRELNKTKVNRIVNNFNPLLVNPIKVSFRNGKYWVFDGQNTMAALKVRAGNKDCSVKCKIYYGLTELDEANLFIEQNGYSTNVSTADKLRVLYNYGDESVRDMVKAAELAGVRVDFTKGQAYFKVTAVQTLYKCYQMLTREQFIDMLATIRSTWLGIPESFSKEILNGMTKFYLSYWNEFKNKDLAKSLSKIPPAAIVREGRGFGAASSTSTVYARAILRQYNNNRSTHRLEDKL